MPRNWSTKTLYARVMDFIEKEGIDPRVEVITEMLDRMRDQIVEEAVNG